MGHPADLLLKYARVERERRFLLDGPPALPAGCPVLLIEDRYLTGTRLRLRTVRETGAETVHKLGQKVPGDGATVAHTTMYLSPAEFAALAVLPGDRLVKRRTLVPWVGLALAVDVFGGPLTGLVLAEVDLGSEGTLPTGPAPVTWLAEVTDDPRFRGGALAGRAAAGLASAAPAQHASPAG